LLTRALVEYCDYLLPENHSHPFIYLWEILKIKIMAMFLFSHAKNGALLNNKEKENNWALSMPDFNL